MCQTITLVAIVKKYLKNRQRVVFRNCHSFFMFDPGILYKPRGFIPRHVDIATVYAGYCLVNVDVAALLLSGTSRHKLNSSLSKRIERNLMARCASSLSELADVVSQTMHHW